MAGDCIFSAAWALSQFRVPAGLAVAWVFPVCAHAHAGGTEACSGPLQLHLPLRVGLQLRVRARLWLWLRLSLLRLSRGLLLARYLCQNICRYD